MSSAYNITKQPLNEEPNLLIVNVTEDSIVKRVGTGRDRDYSIAAAREQPTTHSTHARILHCCASVIIQTQCGNCRGWRVTPHLMSSTPPPPVALVYLSWGGAYVIPTDRTYRHWQFLCVTIM